jgi:hypothetical protein
VADEIMAAERKDLFHFLRPIASLECWTPHCVPSSCRPVFSIHTSRWLSPLNLLEFCVRHPCGVLGPRGFQ